MENFEQRQGASGVRRDRRIALSQGITTTIAEEIDDDKAMTVWEQARDLTPDAG